MPILRLQLALLAHVKWRLSRLEKAILQAKDRSVLPPLLIETLVLFHAPGLPNELRNEAVKVLYLIGRPILALDYFPSNFVDCSPKMLQTTKVLEGEKTISGT